MYRRGHVTTCVHMPLEGRLGCCSPGTGGTSDSELPTVSAGNQTQVLSRGNSALTCWPISPALASESFHVCICAFKAFLVTSEWVRDSGVYYTFHILMTHFQRIAKFNRYFDLYVCDFIIIKMYLVLICVCWGDSIYMYVQVSPEAGSQCSKASEAGITGCCELCPKVALGSKPLCSGRTTRFLTY